MIFLRFLNEKLSVFRKKDMYCTFVSKWFFYVFSTKNCPFLEKKICRPSSFKDEGLHVFHFCPFTFLDSEKCFKMGISGWISPLFWKKWPHFLSKLYVIHGSMLFLSISRVNGNIQALTVLVPFLSRNSGKLFTRISSFLPLISDVLFPSSTMAKRVRFSNGKKRKNNNNRFY